MAAADHEVGHAAEVRLHKHAHGPGTPALLDEAGGGADAPLEAEADGAAARADGASGEVLARAVDGGEHLLRAYGPGLDAADAPVVRLADHGVHALGERVPCALLFSKGILYQRVRDAADVHRAGERDGRLEVAELGDLDGAAGLSVAVEGMGGGHGPRGEDRALTGDDDRHARVQLLCRVVDGRVPDLDVRYIGDAVARAARERPHRKTV